MCREVNKTNNLHVFMNIVTNPDVAMRLKSERSLYFLSGNCIFIFQSSKPAIVSINSKQLYKSASKFASFTVIKFTAF